MQFILGLREFGHRAIGSLLALVVMAALALPAISSSAMAAPQFAALTVDARTGKLIFASDADGRRHPASLTKMMTLYLLFQDLKSGKIKLSSPIRISARAAAMAPSKLGVKPGTMITVETAIRALVVKSANDVAAAVAENLGGTEAAFAKRMTRTARSIGMSRSTFVNASGLPNSAQITTARDMATLGLRLMRDYPQYYPYFRNMSFTYAGRTIKTHNRLLGKFEGTDGIKTGYVAASGFNLVSSVRRSDKRIVGVVLGGRSGGARDAYMKKMLANSFPSATGGKGVAAAAGSSKGIINAIEPEAPATEMAAAAQAAAKVAVSKTAQIEAQDPPALEASAGDEGDDTAGDAAAAAGTTIKTVKAAEKKTAPQVIEGSVGEPEAPAKLPFAVKKEAVQQAVDAVVVASLPRETWSVQIGTYADKKDAQARLLWLKAKVPAVLSGKQALTVTIQKGDDTTYRGRFSGFDETGAKAACKKIIRQKSECQVLAPAS